MALFLLMLAIVSEVIGSVMLKISNGFKELFPTLLFISGYVISFYLFSRALLELPLGLSYAAWSGIGTLLTAIAGVLIFKEKINRQGMLGIGILIAGIVLLNF